MACCSLSATVGALRMCDGKLLCGLCRAVTKVTPEVIRRLRAEYCKPCEFCRQIHVRKHFDHINMFSKVNCVGIMVENGINSADIIKEIDKCQIVCTECHRKITAYERKRGFITKKRQLNRRIRRGEDIMALRAELFGKYMAIMSRFYARLRAVAEIRPLPARFRRWSI